LDNFLLGQGRNVVLVVQVVVKLHAFGDFDAKEAHAVLDDIGDVLGEHEADGFLLLVGLIQNAIVVVELVEDLCELVAVVGNTAGAIIFTSLLYGSTEFVHLLNQLDLLFTE
jgi:high-affinity nickel permease